MTDSFATNPRNYPEDAADSDNGHYLHLCPTCKLGFIGHKRRVGQCKVCATVDDAEAKRRADWLTAHGAPLDWVVLTSGEVAEMKAHLVKLVWDNSELRRLLTEATDWIDPKSPPPDLMPSQITKRLREELAKIRS